MVIIIIMGMGILEMVLLIKYQVYNNNLLHNGNILNKYQLENYIYKEVLIWLKYYKKEGIIVGNVWMFWDLWSLCNFKIFLNDQYIDSF